MIAPPQDSRFADMLEAKLLSELRASSEQGENVGFSLEVTSADGTSLGGLSASTSYGWLLIKVLFIEPSARGRGHGRDLLEAAFKHARGHGCHSAWLDTSNPSAHRFYLKQGFVPFAALRNEVDHAPRGHQRWFMKREI